MRLTTRWLFSLALPLCSLCSLTPLSYGQSGAAPVSTGAALGINISGLAYWSTEWPLLDEMKRARFQWLTQCNRRMGGCDPLQAPASAWDTRESSRLDLDPNGWVRSLPVPDDTGVNYRAVATLLLSGNGGQYPSGQYTVLYDGEGRLEYGNDAVKNSAQSQPGRDVLEVRAGNSGILLRITATDPQKTGNYLRNIRVIGPGGICNSDPFAYAASAAACPDGGGSYTPFTEIDATQRFHPLFLRDLRPYRAIRFMDLLATNTSTLVEWADRPRLEHARWSGPNGAPLELALELAIRLNADPWINLPVRASDDYATQAARLTRARLGPRQRVYLEYANEVWNDAFSAGAWVQQQALQRWPDRPGGPSPFTRRINGYGQRATELCARWKQEWGPERDRVICVMGGMSANSWVSEQALQCPLWAAENGGHACAEHMDALAIAPYFGNHLGSPENASVVAGWTVQDDGGLSLLFQELAQGEVLNRSNLALPAVFAQINRHRVLADRYGLALLAYEGGQHLVGVGAVQNDRRLETLFTTANRDPRMGGLYADYLAGWRRQGGQLFMLFNSVGRYGKYGSWGVKEYQTQTGAPKHEALLRFIAANPCGESDCAGAK